jgi:iron-sulfur cluster assembly protein
MDIPVTITDRAFQEICKIKNTKNIPQRYGLRIGIKGGGCAGVTYLLGFDTAAKDDGTFELKGLQIHISKKHTMHVIGLTLDYYEGSDTRGFMFSHPDHPESAAI